MTGITIVLTEETEESDLAVVRMGLRRFNARFAEPPDWRSFLVKARDKEGEVVGGLEGTLGWRWLYVDNLWVADDHRGQGLGTELLSEAERFARSSGCIGSYLDTFGFQAREFYAGNGYEVFGVLEGYPPGSESIYMRKSLSDDDRPATAFEGKP